MIDLSSLNDLVLESYELECRRHFRGRDTSKLCSGEDVRSYLDSVYYRRLPRVRKPSDQGYIVFNDLIRQRYV